MTNVIWVINLRETSEMTQTVKLRQYENGGASDTGKRTRKGIWSGSVDYIKVINSA